MVSLSTFEKEWVGLKNNQELESIACFLFRQGNVSQQTGGSSSSKIFNAVVSNNADVFRSVVAELEHRDVTVQSTWISNDVLIFFLLIGLTKYKLTFSNLNSIFTARDKSLTGFESEVTRVFRELEQENYGLHSHADFVKIVYCDLVCPEKLGLLDLNVSLQTLTGPTLLPTLSPFFRILALRSYTIILAQKESKSSDRVSSALAVVGQLQTNTLTPRETVRLLTLFPVKTWLVIISLLAAVFTAGGVFQAYRSHLSHIWNSQREVPVISVTTGKLPIDLLSDYGRYSNDPNYIPFIITIKLRKDPDYTGRLILSVPTTDVKNAFLLSNSDNASRRVQKGTITGNTVTWWVNQTTDSDDEIILFPVDGKTLGELENHISLSFQ